MNTRLLSLLGLVAALGGCATPFRAPGDVAHIALARVDSSAVLVDKIWLERDGGDLFVRGYVLRKLTATTTRATHLDAILFDASGRVLRTITVEFQPREIPTGARRVRSAAYRVPLDPLPTGTARIEIHAHDGLHVGG